MAHNRAQLNSLIFHNRTVLPLTSPGYAEMTLAVAELQGGNNAKAALYAEAAVARDVTLAAGWLGKLAADVFEATPDDLRKDRALFCMDRALECAPACRREIVEFFVANILGHYVEVLCAGALAELARWTAREASADELEREALELDWRATQRHAGATLLEAAGLVSGMVALFSRRLGTQVFSGMMSAAAFSEAAHMTREAALLEGMAGELRTAEYALRLGGKEHRRASMLYLLPARDLIGVAARLLQAEGLSAQLLDRLIQALTGSFREVLGGHLRHLCRELGAPMSAAIKDSAQSLAATYVQDASLPAGLPPNAPDFWLRAAEYRRKSAPVINARAHDLYTGPHPLSRETVRWLGQMLSGVQSLEAYRLLSHPLPTIAQQVYGFAEGKRSRTLPARMDAANQAVKMRGGCLVVATLVCLFIAPPVLVFTLAGIVYYLIKHIRLDRARARLRTIFDSLWSVDTWLAHPVGTLAVADAREQHGPPPLPGGVQGRTPGVRASLSAREIALIGLGSLLCSVCALVLLGALREPRTPAAPAVKPSEPPTASVAASGGDANKPTPPEVRRALPVSTSAQSSFRQTNPPPASTSPEPLYSVIGVPDGDTLNVRAGPGMKNNVTARLPGGTAHVEITGASMMNERTEWVPIKVGNQSGWVTKQHLQRE